MNPAIKLLDAELAALWTGRPPSTIRRWAAEGRITRYGKGRGHVRYNAWELPAKTRDEATGEINIPPPPPLPTATLSRQ